MCGLTFVKPCCFTLSSPSSPHVTRKFPAAKSIQILTASCWPLGKGLPESLVSNLDQQTFSLNDLLSFYYTDQSLGLQPLKDALLRDFFRHPNILRLDARADTHTDAPGLLLCLRSYFSKRYSSPSDLYAKKVQSQWQGYPGL
jgi:hypothetical protein